MERVAVERVAVVPRCSTASHSEQRKEKKIDSVKKKTSSVYMELAISQSRRSQGRALAGQ